MEKQWFFFSVMWQVKLSEQLSAITLANHMLNFQIYYKKPFQRTELTRLLGGFKMVISLQSKIVKQAETGTGAWMLIFFFKFF